MTDLGRARIGGIPCGSLRRYGVTLPLSLVYILVLLAIFASLITTQINSQRIQRFLSLDSSRDPNLICAEVPLSLTETHFGTYTGVWETQQNYRLNQSLFDMRFKGAKLTSNQYRSAMDFYKQQTFNMTEKYGSKMAILNVLILVISLDFYDIPNLELSTSADATYLFNGGVTYAYLVNRDGVCIGSSSGQQFISAGYSFATSSLEFSLPLYLDNTYLQNEYLPLGALGKALLADAPCTQKFGGLLIDYLTEWMTEYRRGTIDFKFDVRSAMAAIGMNLGVDLQNAYVRVNAHEYLDSGRMQGFIAFIDPWYGSGMDPFWCLDKNFEGWQLSEDEKNGPPICFVIGHESWPSSTVYYPVMSQIANDARHCEADGRCKPMTCECAEYQLTNWGCAANRFVVGLVFGTSAAVQPAFDDYTGVSQGVREETVSFARKMQRFLIEDSDNGDTNAIMHVSNMLAYSLVAARAPAIANRSIKSYTDRDGKFYDNSWANGKSYNDLLRAEWDALGCDNCSAMVFEVDGARAINKFGTELTQIPKLNPSLQYLGCKNSMQFNDAFDKMAAIPPVQLVYPYQECQKTLSSIAITAFGSSIATTNFFGAIAWGLAGYFVVWMLKSRSSGELLLGENRKALVSAAYEQVQKEALLAHLHSLSRLNALYAARLMQLDDGGKTAGNSDEDGSIRGNQAQVAELVAAQQSASLTLEQLTQAYEVVNAETAVGSRVTETLQKLEKGGFVGINWQRDGHSSSSSSSTSTELDAPSRRLSPGLRMDHIYPSAAVQQERRLSYKQREDDAAAFSPMYVEQDPPL